ncbi:MAG TPA: putative glycolipid-binding domain-containing protein [Polyangia bacterium]
MNTGEAGAVSAEAGQTVANIVWQRLDVPGRDVCRLARLGAGWQIAGEATFVEGGADARLGYRVACDDAWQTLDADLEGTLGGRTVEASFARSGALWTCNGQPVGGLGGCVDLDLGFTPATNLLQLRRVALTIGQGVDVPVAWFDLGSRTLERLAQRYERRSPTTYWYESARFHYAARLEVDEAGFVIDYPALWRRAAAASSSGLGQSRLA